MLEGYILVGMETKMKIENTFRYLKQMGLD